MRGIDYLCISSNSCIVIDLPSESDGLLRTLVPSSVREFTVLLKSSFEGVGVPERAEVERLAVAH